MAFAIKIGNTKYDTVFNLADETEVSCIELIRVGLRHCMLETEYLQRFPHLEELIKVRKNLTPDMLRNCLDFKVVFEQRR